MVPPGGGYQGVLMWQKVSYKGAQCGYPSERGIRGIPGGTVEMHCGGVFLVAVGIQRGYLRNMGYPRKNPVP